MPLAENGIGVEQLPCLECLGWGGVSRTSSLRFMPTIFRYADSKLFPIVRGIVRIWLLRYRRLCKKVVKAIAIDMKNLVDNGYDIVGIIAMNDSPTCGVTKTIGIIDFVAKSKSMGLKLEDLTSPSFDKMKEVLPSLLVTGRGLFMTELLFALRRQAIVQRVFEFNPWNDIKTEAGRVVGEILQTR